MIPNRHICFWVYWSSAVATLVVALAAANAPIDPGAGAAQKIASVHVPLAINTCLACLVAFVANIGYIWQRGTAWDDLGAAAAQVAVLLCCVLLVTGMIWAHQAWNHWWTWSPLPTFSLILCLLYLAYVILHRIAGPSRRSEIACAVYGVIAFLDVPLVYLSVKLLPDRHPSELRMSAEMLNTLMVWGIPTTLICAGLIAAGYRLNRNARMLTVDKPPQIDIGNLGGVH